MDRSASENPEIPQSQPCRRSCSNEIQRRRKGGVNTKEKCVFCGKDIDTKNYASFKVRGEDKYCCLPCHAENKEAIGYMCAIESMQTKYGKEVVMSVGNSGGELVPIDDVKKEKKE